MHKLARIREEITLSSISK